MTEIFAFAVAYGLYLTLSTIVLVIVILETDFFGRKFGVALESEKDANGRKDHNNCQLHMIVYLQVAMITQALIFITRSHSFFFIERPLTALLGAFGVAQLASFIIATHADWGFTDIHSVSGGWIGIVWIWVSGIRVLVGDSDANR